MMLKPKIAMRPRAPPARLLTQPRMPSAEFLLRPCASCGGVDARNRNAGAEAVDDQRAERERDCALEVFGLGERARS
jgi:hypothetical protein